ncbi:MAG: hypothetical protein HYY76_12405 [Acidobacteria bacterium]|nr:hypothetical protein [Acidobacteriota bacterium]
MQMLSDDDRNLRGMTDEELVLAWDLWFDLAQTTNESDPPYTHGVFATGRRSSPKNHRVAMPDGGADEDFRRMPET